MKTKDAGVSDSATGLGDSSLSLKAALPSSSENFSWTGLAGVTFATGEVPFTAGKPQYRLATAMSLKLNDTYSSGFYINLNHFDGKTAYTLSPDLSFVLSDSLGVYLEADSNNPPDFPPG